MNSADYYNPDPLLHIGFAKRLALQYYRRNRNWLHSLDLDDLAAIAFMALLEASQSYRGTLNGRMVRFTTYAHFYVIGRLKRARAEYDHMIRTPSGHTEGYRRQRAKDHSRLKQSELIRNAHQHNLDQESPIHWSYSDNERCAFERKDMVDYALSKLDQRSATLLRLYYLDGLTIDQCAWRTHRSRRTTFLHLRWAEDRFRAALAREQREGCLP